jgi:hypothetical protein
MKAATATERIAVAAEDVRHLHHGTHAAASGGWRHLQPQAVERAGVPRIVLVATCV